MYLPHGTILHNRYQIESVLGHGGFGITYAAYDQSFGARVAIKEYLPRHLATRGEGQSRVSVYSGEARRHYDYGLKKFMEEAHLLAQFAHHPNVVSAREYFAANGTAYMVMEYAEGVTLKEYLEKKGGRIPFEEARSIMMPVMDALREVHQVGLLHRDISPDNIYITTAAQVRVIDFGAARYFAGEQSKSLSVILKSGYAPEEQYRSKGQQGPWTDVYATGATLYRALTGRTPPEALDRKEQDTLEPPSRLGVEMPPHTEGALLQALAVKAEQRFQNMGEFQQALLGGAVVTGGSQPAPEAFPTAPEPGHASGSTPFSSPGPIYAPSPAPPAHYPQTARRGRDPAAVAVGIAGGVVALVILVALVWGLVGPATRRDVRLPPGGSQGPAAAPVAPTRLPPTPPGTARFTKAANGVITDGATGLEWYVGPDRDTTWKQAKSWAENLHAAGGGWRLPTLDELKALHQQRASRRNLASVFSMTSYWVWSGNLQNSTMAWNFSFDQGREDWHDPEGAYSRRAFGVRFPQSNQVRPQTEDLRREAEQLSAKIRLAHLNKDINKWLSCYGSSYPHLGQLETRQLELWKSYDIKEVNYSIANVQRVSDINARYDIVWNIQLYDHRTHDYILVRQKYQTILGKGPGGWKICASKELAGG
jgi:serine/threonine protein kinase